MTRQDDDTEGAYFKVQIIKQRMHLWRDLFCDFATTNRG